MLTPDQEVSHRANNFDTLRIVAAVAVLCSHSIPLSYGPSKLDILNRISNGQNVTFGQLAVQAFFVISGYLITASYMNRPSPRHFIRARFLRLVPGLLVLFAVLAFIAGPLLTSLPLADYFAGLPRDKFGVSDHLPGVFSNNPFSAGVDGSLWTLRYEAECYAAILLLGLARLLNRYVLLAMFVLVLALRVRVGPLPSADLGALFFAGAMLRAWDPPFSVTFAAPAMILWGISLFFSGYTLMSATAGAYVILTIALMPDFKLPNLAKYGDLSYGVYIYAWPVQQAAVFLFGNRGWMVNAAVSLPVVLGLAWLSWHFVESPALRLKNQKLFAVL